MEQNIACQTYNDIKFGVDVDDTTVGITDGQGRDVVIHKHVQGLDDRRLRSGLPKHTTICTYRSSLKTRYCRFLI